MRLPVVLLLSAILSGCTALAVERAASEAKETMQRCQADYESGTIKTCVEMANCSNFALDKVSQAGYPYGDLIEYNKAQRVSICRKVDKRKISFEEAKLEMAKVGVEISTEEQRRSFNQAQMHSANMQATGILMQGLAANRPARPTHCTTMQTGSFGTINCH